MHVWLIKQKQCVIGYFAYKLSAITLLFQNHIAEYNNDWIINANFSLFRTKLHIKLKTLWESKETIEENKFYVLIPVETPWPTFWKGSSHFQFALCPLNSVVDADHSLLSQMLFDFRNIYP